MYVFMFRHGGYVQRLTGVKRIVHKSVVCLSTLLVWFSNQNSSYIIVSLITFKTYYS